MSRSRRREEPTPESNQAEVLIVGRPLSRDPVAWANIQSGHPEKWSSVAQSRQNRVRCR